MVLLYEIIEMLRVADNNRGLMNLVVVLNRGRITALPIHVLCSLLAYFLHKPLIT